MIADKEVFVHLSGLIRQLYLLTFLRRNCGEAGGSVNRQNRSIKYKLAACLVVQMCDEAILTMLEYRYVLCEGDERRRWSF